MSTFKLPKDPHASVGRGPGSPGCVEVSRGCVTSGRCLPTLSSVLSSVNEEVGQRNRPTSLQPVEWTFYRSCLEERSFL